MRRDSLEEFMKKYNKYRKIHYIGNKQHLVLSHGIYMFQFLYNIPYSGPVVFLTLQTF
jgi:hypothetical protein